MQSLTDLQILFIYLLFYKVLFMKLCIVAIKAFLLFKKQYINYTQQ